jgi:phytoene dehydrogenase-like protein
VTGDLHHKVKLGHIPPEVSFGGGHITTFDPSQAPPGRHTAYGWHAMPFAPDGDSENIEPVKHEFAERMLDVWRKYAPNLTADNIMHCHVYTANDYSKDLVNMVRGTSSWARSPATRPCGTTSATAPPSPACT